MTEQMHTPTASDTQEFTLRAMARNYAGGHLWDKLDGETAINAANEIRALRAALSASSHPIVCRVMPMRLSSGETDYYVSIERAGRQITPHRHRIKGRAEYEVARWNHVLNGADEPDILAFDCDGTDAAALSQQVQS